MSRPPRAYQVAHSAAVAMTVGAGKELEEVEEALLTMHTKQEWIDISANELTDLDLVIEGEYHDLRGEHVMIPVVHHPLWPSSLSARLDEGSSAPVDE